MRIVRNFAGSKSAHVIGKLWGHKFFEAGWARAKTVVQRFEFSISFKTSGDHPGLRTHIEMGGLMLECDIYDERHWDWEKNTWQAPHEADYCCEQP